MGAAASVDGQTFDSVEAALAAGKTQEEIDAYLAAHPVTEAPVTTEAVPATEAPPTTDAAPAAEESASDGIDRSGIERNKNGSEEPSSADPELWNIDGTEVDLLVKYKVGGQMWYVQSRMRENPPKGMPIPGVPMNQKAINSKRYYKDDDDKEYNTENDKSTWWNKEMQVPPA
eukprot:g4544.t1